MLQDLVSEAREQAERSAPAVKTAALCHLARVLTKVAPAEAEHVLDEGLALAATLPEDDRDVLLGEAAALAATVSPRKAFPLARQASLDRESVLLRALLNMLEHGHVADAVAYLSDPNPADVYPFGAALTAMSRASDEESRLRVFRGAIRAMREQQSSSPGPLRDGDHFMRLFTYHWRSLPADEARSVVRDLVECIQGEPDSRTSARISSGSHTVQFSSTHEQRLFGILSPLRHLDPDLASSIAGDYPQLSAAAERFPYGEESMNASMQAQRPPTPREPIEQPDYIDVGRRLIPIPEAIRTEFKEAFAVALDLYAADSNPEKFNDAPEEVWPSALEFRKILYKAGQYEGPAAARHLDRVPAPALRLLAQIELAAALAGLPQLGGRTIRPGPGGLRDMMPARRDRTSPLSATPSAMPVVPPPRKPKLPPSRALHISPATLPAGEGPSGGSGPDFVEIRNASLKAVVSKLYDMPETRIDWPSWLDPDARHDFVLVLPRPESRETMTRLMREGIAKHFRVAITSEIRSRDAYVLTAPNGIAARPAPQDSTFEFGSIGIGAVSTGARNIGPPPIPDALLLGDILSMPMAFSEVTQSGEEVDEVLRRLRGQLLASLGLGAWIGGIDASLTLNELCATIEGGLDRPLIDETNLTGTYAIGIHTEATTTADFLRALCDTLGLVLTTGRRDVRVLVVRSSGV
jgi:uncharacterized protein (TIGR03435 family)